jgi:hypothetical protein
VFRKRIKRDSGLSDLLPATDKAVIVGGHSPVDFFFGLVRQRFLRAATTRRDDSLKDVFVGFDPVGVEQSI